MKHALKMHVPACLYILYRIRILWLYNTVRYSCNVAYKTLSKYFIQVLSFVTPAHITQTATRVGPNYTLHSRSWLQNFSTSASQLKFDVKGNAATDNRRVLKNARKTWHSKNEDLVQFKVIITSHDFSPDDTLHLPKLRGSSHVNIHWIYCIENIFTVQDFWATCACLKNRAFPEIFTVLNIFLTIQDFWATLRLQWNTEFALKILTVFNVLFTFRVCEQLALAVNSLYWIYFLQWRAVRFVTGEALSLSKPSLRVYESNSVNSPLNWLLAEWLLLMLSIPCHNLLHTHRHNGDSRFEKK